MEQFFSTDLHMCSSTQTQLETKKAHTHVQQKTNTNKKTYTLVHRDTSINTNTLTHTHRYNKKQTQA